MKKTIAALLIIAAPLAALACPPELIEAGKTYAGELAAREREIFESKKDAPVGVVPTQGFDLANHECHEMAGQAYKIYREPSCELAEGGKKAALRYPFDLNYRRANSTEELFAEPWQKGSDGIWLVTFELTAEGWKPTGQREELDFGRKTTHPSGTPQK